jgi:hypothetical protein
MSIARSLFPTLYKDAPLDFGGAGVGQFEDDLEMVFADFDDARAWQLSEPFRASIDEHRIAEPPVDRLHVPAERVVEGCPVRGGTASPGDKALLIFLCTMYGVT